MWYNSGGQIFVHILSTRTRFQENNTRTHRIQKSKKSYIQGSFLPTGAGNNPMVGMTVAVAVAVEEASK